MLSSRVQWTRNLPALTPSYRCVVIELWGHGRSPTPRDPALYSPASYAAQFEAIRAEVGADRWYVVGQSLGAALTLGYVLERPQSVDRSGLHQLELSAGRARLDDASARVLRETGGCVSSRRLRRDPRPPPQPHQRQVAGRRPPHRVRVGHRAARPGGLGADGAAHIVGVVGLRTGVGDGGADVAGWWASARNGSWRHASTRSRPSPTCARCRRRPDMRPTSPRPTRSTPRCWPFSLIIRRPEPPAGASRAPWRARPLTIPRADPRANPRSASGARFGAAGGRPGQPAC